MTKFIDVEVLDGSEPIYKEELSKTDLIKTLNWYSRNKDTKDSEKYILTYFKKTYNKDILYPIKELSNTFGFLCRIISNGGILPKENVDYFENKITDILNYKKKRTTNKIEERVIKKENEITSIDIILCLIDSAFDKFILTEYNDIPYTDFEIVRKLTKNDYYSLVKFVTNDKMKYVDILESNDEELILCYNNKSTVKKIIRFYEKNIDDITKIFNEKCKDRKPRKKKKYTVEDLVKKVNYCKEYNELNLKSINPRLIIGSKGLITFNAKNNKIGLYVAKNNSLLSFDKGKLINYDENKSYQKVVRTPIDIIDKINKTDNMNKLIKILVDIETTDLKLNGVINNNIILLRALN